MRSSRLSATLAFAVVAASLTSVGGPAIAASGDGRTITARGQALEDAARKAKASEITESQRLALAAKSGVKPPAISTSSIQSMNRMQTALNAAAKLSPNVNAQSAPDPTVDPHYFGPYSNYANSPQHLPTALVTFSAPPSVLNSRVAQGTAIVDNNGVVTGVTVTDPGAGYTAPPTVTVTSIGAGSGAKATAVLTQTVSSLTLVQAGLGYNDPVTVKFSGGGGTGAAATATLDTHGSILALNLTSHGSGYTSKPTITFSDAVGAASVKAVATAVLSKSVSAVTVTSGGTGYITPGLRKFVDTLPVLGSVGVDGTNPVTKNNLGQYIPEAIPDSTTYPGSDYYEIAVVQYREQVHSDLPAAGTLQRGYVQLSTATIPGKHVPLTNALVDGTTIPALLPNGQQAYAVDYPHSLGPVLSATKDRPVRVLFRDLLPTGVNGDLFLPVDTTVMGAGPGPNTPMAVMAQNMGIGTDAQHPLCADSPKPNLPNGNTWCYTENRATIHLHGGLTPWISDGTPHQWITPAGETTEYPQGVSVKNVPDMPDPGPGAQTFFYTNQQSARMLFYHDHSWGITRLNVYVGEASAYMITDSTEQSLISSGTIPGPDSTIPLIVQDRTYVPTAAELSVTDPTWNTAAWGGEGNLWLPHVYMTAQNAQDSSGVNQFGRWMYGPWFWPPTTDLTVAGLIPNPYAGQYDSQMNWTEPTAWAQIPGVPAESMGMEAYNDTPLVNGTAYPTVTLDPKSYRFRILNAADDRFWNLQLYKAAGKNKTEVALLPADVAAGKIDPTVEPKPDTSVSTPGPSWIQIGTEGGFLPTPAVIPPTPIGYITDPTVFDFGNINRHSLLLGPAERADVIVDFSQFAGQTLILYNDAPAAAPARDPRYDYYTDDADLRSTGGAATTPEGYGPNTRTIMQIKVAAKAPAKAFDMTKLNVAFQATELGGGGVFENSQNPILVGQGAYDQAYGTDFASSTNDGSLRMTSNTLTFNTLGVDSSGNHTDTGVQTKNTTSVAMHDEMGAAYDKQYGRMSGSMGVEAPAVSAGLAQALTLYPYVQPPTEEWQGDVLPPGDTAVQLPSNGEYGDNVQIWKITHNGVDSHPIHFHLVDVQLINRVSWDGIIRPNDPNELGWKDTVRVNPLSDTIVAMRPIIPQTPFGVDKSVRSPNPAMPDTATAAEAGLLSVLPDANGSPWLVNGLPLDNAKMDFGWEYVWHCHILSHEEMDMMRPIKVDVPYSAPNVSLLRVSTTGGNTLNWTDPTPASPDGSINASWGDPTNEIGYKIERTVATWNATTGQFDAGTFAALTDPTTSAAATALANQRTYIDTTAVSGTTYFYRVAAWNAADTTTYSDPVLAGNPPGAPAGLSGSPLPNSILVNWGALVLPARTLQASAAVQAHAVNTSTPTGYELEYRADNAGSWSEPIELAAGVRSAQVSDLTSRDGYVFRVRALHAPDAPGPWSMDSDLVQPQTVPAAPKSLVSTAGLRQVNLHWTAAENGGQSIRGYKIEKSTDAGTSWTTITGNTMSTAASYLASSLVAGQSVKFRVSAVNGVGTGPASAASAAVVPFTVPNAPLAVAARAFGNRALQVLWSPPSSDGGAAITSYRVEVTHGTGWTFAANVPASGSSFTLGNLSAGLGYAFRVAANNAGGAGGYVTTTVVKPVTLPSAPSVLIARSTRAGTASLTWAVPYNGGSPLRAYQIDVSVNDGPWTLNRVSTSPYASSFLVTGLSVSAVYRFRVAGVNVLGRGAPSPQSLPVRPIQLPGPPRLVGGAVVDSNSILVWWAAPATAAKSVSGYEVQYSSDSGRTWRTYAPGSGLLQLSRRVYGLLDETTYVFKVRALSAGGPGPWSPSRPSIRTL